MRGLKVLALTAAMAAVSSSAFAMEAMDENDLSAATGQSGIDINLNQNVTIDHIRWRDNDGFSTADATPTAYTNAAYLDIANLGITGNVTVKLDAGATTAGVAALHVNVATTNLSITPFTLSVAQDVQTVGTTTGSTFLSDTDTTGGKSFATVAITNINLQPMDLTITPGFKDQGGSTGVPAANQGITIHNAGSSSLTASLGVYSTATASGKTVPDAYLFRGDLAITNMGAQDISIGALSSGDITALKAAGAVLPVSSGAMWISMGAQTIGSVAINNIQVGDVGTAPSIGDIALVGVKVGATNIFIGAH